MKDKLTSVIKNKSMPKSMDYNLLRKESIENSQKVSGDIWTDYNLHDPGVTILEQFCYALTDIAYRTNLPIETLLFHAGEPEKVLKSNSLFAPNDVLPSAPVTLTDYRILILDHFPDKLSNCWVDIIKDHKEGIQGLYDITLLVKNDVRKDEYNTIEDAVNKLFIQNRNLGEDLNKISILKPEKIALKAEIDIYQDENAEDILVEVLHQIENYFNPTIQFSTIENLEKKGWSLNDIFDVPSFMHGFITYDQLRDKPKEFYVSKIADHILDIKGVRGLRNLQVIQDGVPTQGDIITVDDSNFLTLGLLDENSDQNKFQDFSITLYKGGAINNYLPSSVIYSLEMKEAKSNRNYEIQTRLNSTKKTAVNTSELLSLQSIQKSFPGIYGVGDYTPANEEGAQRLAQSNQLKAYLMFFDQLMSNHLAQLSQLSHLFSINSIDANTSKTYFSQLLGNNIPEASELLRHTLDQKSILIKRKEELEAIERNKKENNELENLVLDIQNKENIVAEQVIKIYNELNQLSQDKIFKSKKVENRVILQKLVDLNKMEKEAPDQGTAKQASKSAKKREKGLNEIKKLIKDEVEEKVHDIPLEQRHLESLMEDFDNSNERKNRVLTHLLARFGERFTTDFHIKFSSLMEGHTQEKIDQKLISLKSTFLKEIVFINKKRAKGINYLSEKSAQEIIPLKQKISLLLDFKSDKDDYPSSILKSSLKIRKLSGAEINQSDKSTSLSPKERNKKITFLINSSSYYNYLFKYGMKEENYTVEMKDRLAVLSFSPPTKEIPTRLFTADTIKTAQEKMHGIINYLRKVNAQSENFHIVEHILLRPLDSSDCYFSLLDENEATTYLSKEAKPEEEQKKTALDTLLLGCYSNNYRTLLNPAKEYVVTIKNSIGKDLVKSSESFLTEQSAQKFIEMSILHFSKQKEAGNFEDVFKLDNQKKYFFDIIDQNSDILYESITPNSISVQEEQVEDLAIFTLNPSCYQVSEISGTAYTVVLNNYHQEHIAQSNKKFNTIDEAEDFIGYCIQYFEKINNANTYRAIVRYRRLDGRNAEEFNSQISVVYSAWTSRFDNHEFLQLFKQTLFNCAPAHLSINLVGLDYLKMSRFENLYAEYMKGLRKVSIENQEQLASLSNELLEILDSQ